MICNKSHTPNAATESAMLECRLMQAHRIIRNLLDYAVYDKERDDFCYKAVKDAEVELER